LVAWFLVFDMHLAREHKVEDSRSAADLIGTNSTAALAIGDPQGAAKLLEALSTPKQVRLGALYRSDGAYFASYTRADLSGKLLSSERPPDGINWTADRLTHTSPVRLEQRGSGWLYLESDITDLKKGRASLNS
jgi:hypothetical protein